MSRRDDRNALKHAEDQEIVVPRGDEIDLGSTGQREQLIVVRIAAHRLRQRRRLDELAS